MRSLRGRFAEMCILCRMGKLFEFCPTSRPTSPILLVIKGKQYLPTHPHSVVMNKRIRLFSIMRVYVCSVAVVCPVVP